MTTEQLTNLSDLVANAPSPPSTPGACATIACIWEATAAKPGNVYRGADFDDLTYVDFLTSAAVVGPIIDQAAENGVGTTVLEAVRATRAAVGTNTNLGMMLLIGPLAVVPQGQSLRSGIGDVLAATTLEDTAQIYEAIRVARPGGLGDSYEADVHDVATPQLLLVEAMQLAAERDLVARQYVDQFAQVFLAANLIEDTLNGGDPLGEAIVLAAVQLLVDYPDSLVARKCGVAIAEEVSQRAASVWESRKSGDVKYGRAIKEFDFWLRADGHRRNPGTTADLIAAGLFVLLREQRLDWPIRFYADRSPGDRRASDRSTE